MSFATVDIQDRHLVYFKRPHNDMRCSDGLGASDHFPRLRLRIIGIPHTPDEPHLRTTDKVWVPPQVIKENKLPRPPRRVRTSCRSYSSYEFVLDLPRYAFHLTTSKGNYPTGTSLTQDRWHVVDTEYGSNVNHHVREAG